MSKLFKVLSFVIVILFLSCNKDKKEPVVVNGKVDLNATDSKSKVDFSDKKVQEVYDLYLVMKGALVNSDSKQVQLESKKLQNILDDSKENKQLKATAKLISLTKDIKKQRDFFVTISSEVELRISKTKINSGEVYKQYCPMAFDGAGGYWLSDSEEIRNPYFGKSMLVCGDVKNTFK